MERRKKNKKRTISGKKMDVAGTSNGEYVLTNPPYIDKFFNFWTHYFSPPRAEGNTGSTFWVEKRQKRNGKCVTKRKSTKI